jgi:UDP-N-acetylglucosamine--N-acetylmuramyl-(pentapeptide) pyrophosphoryl-undecaprenol N-acetylglucosamine transferase
MPSDDMNKRLVAFHAINGIGLGHLSRLIAIALAIRERGPNTDVLFIVEGSSHGLLEAANLPYMTIPRVKDSETSASGLASKKKQLHLAFANSIVKIIRPDLIIFDSYIDAAFHLAARSNGVPFAVCARKMKDMERFFETLTTSFSDVQLILIPHEAEEIDIPNEVKERTRFVGPIARRPSQRQPEAAGADRTPNVVITGGGGGYPGTVNFYNLALAALATCRIKEPDLSGLLVTGPLFREWHQLSHVAGAKIIPFDPDITSVFAAADLIICQAGYNTMTEIMSLSVPAICIPGERQFDDQYERAVVANATYPHIHLFDGNDPDPLANLIFQSLRHSPPANNNVIPPRGAGLAAKFIATLLQTV